MKINTFLFVLSLGLITSCANDDFLDGYSRQELFAPPSQEELNVVRSEWESRDLSPDDYQIERIVEMPDQDVTLKIISYRVSGFKEYGALLIPDSDGNLPVRMFINGFGKGITENSVNIVGNSELSFILAIPALRGQSLRITFNGAEYSTPLSEGRHCDAFDGATDDAIAMLNIIESTEERADVNRTAVRGGSRGGTVALLMAERDKRVKITIAVAGPVNLLELTSDNENDETYQCQFLDGLTNNSSSISQARRTMIASSPLFFAEDLPKTQMHFAEDDEIVPVSQGEKMKNEIETVGHQTTFEIYVYQGRNHSNIAIDNKGLNDRIEQLLSEL